MKMYVQLDKEKPGIDNCGRPEDPLLQDSRVRQLTSYSVDMSYFSQGYRLLRRPGWETLREIRITHLLPHDINIVYFRSYR
jgi:hypothetical protein